MINQYKHVNLPLKRHPEHRVGMCVSFSFNLPLQGHPYNGALYTITTEPYKAKTHTNYNDLTAS